MGRYVGLERMENMKELSYVFMTFAMFLAYSCQEYQTDDEAVPARTGYRKTITAGVASDARTRVGFDENNSFYWHNSLYLPRNHRRTLPTAVHDNCHRESFP